MIIICLGLIRGYEVLEAIKEIEEKSLNVMSCNNVLLLSSFLSSAHWSHIIFLLIQFSIYNTDHIHSSARRNI